MITLTVFALFVLYLTIRIRAQRRHNSKTIASIQHRIHVNGIRGKSSVTRLIAAALREGDIKTLGKTTGSSARILLSHQEDALIRRKEADISEQKRILDVMKVHNYEAVVFECMAINPVYQKYLEEKIMQSTIGVITNVREDHTDLLGKTLPEIAKSLCSTVPYNGHLVTAETNPELLDIMQAACEKRGTQLHIVTGKYIPDRYMKRFKHFEYKENVAIALWVAELVGIDTKTALRGMYQAKPDPGAFKMKQFDFRNKTLDWANLFAINDRESFVMTVNALYQSLPTNPEKIVILNNRADRPERVAQFVDIAVNQVQTDYIVTFGDYESQVRREVAKHENGKHIKIIHLGNSSPHRNASGSELLARILSEVDAQEVVMFGAVNIHTLQAESLLSVLEEEYAR